MHVPFIGSEALAAGTLNRHRLRTGHSAVFPGVYLVNSAEPTLYLRTVAAWLWSKRQAVIAGAAAAALHGSKWIDDHEPIELVCGNTRPPQGIATRNDVLHQSEIVIRKGMRVTSVARTAFDLGRRESRSRAVTRLDALCRATGLSTDSVKSVVRDHPGVRGTRQLLDVLTLVDPGAESPKETWLRLLFVDAGLPPPATQIRVVDGGWVARLDMGWPDLMVAVEYDGDQHRSDRRQFVHDVRRLEKLQRIGWIVIRVLTEDRPEDIIGRVRAALEFRANSRRG